MDDRELLAGVNIRKPAVAVKHSSLTRFGDSAYKSVCPVCKEGILPVGRDPRSFELQEYDRCFLCGQQFQYLDIEQLRRKERS